MAGEHTHSPDYAVATLSEPDGHQGSGGELNAAIARATVRIYRAVCGRGPTAARATFRGDTVVVVLDHVLTTAEQVLVASGRPDDALVLRRSLNAVMREPLATAIGELTGTGVRAVMGGNELAPDMAVEVFVLDRLVDPQRDGANSR